MAKRPGGSGKYSVPTTRGDDVVDGSMLDPALQARGLIINGNAGNDTLSGGSGADLINGGDGNDLVRGDIVDLQAVASGTIVWDGGRGTDTLDLSLLPYSAGNGIYVRVSSPTQSSISTDMYYADGTISGPVSSSAQFTDNFKGFENFILGGGDDWLQLFTGTGRNTIYGGAGNDVIRAADQDDFIDGGDGNDIIDGGWGNDVLTGGSGSDWFAFWGNLAGEYTIDRITDFDNDPSDGFMDSLWMGNGYSIVWDPSSPVLRGFVYNSGAAIGEFILEGLTYADAASINIFNGINYDTGAPIGGG